MLLLRVFVSCALLAASSASLPALAAGEPALRAVVGDNNAPFNYLEQGQLKGIGVDVAREVTKRAGLTLAAEPLPWARALATAREEKSVLILTVARTPERETQFAWIGPIADREIWLWRLTSRPDVDPKTFADIKNFHVGDTLNNASVESLKEKGIDVELVSRDDQNGKKMLAGRIDLVPLNAFFVKPFATESGMAPDQLQPVMLLSKSGGYYLALKKDTDPELVRKLDAAFETLKADGTLKAIIARWNPVVPPAAKFAK
jgi:polar amino acid transport system substrate-binding protein